MLIRLLEAHRERFRQDLEAHRLNSQLNDADYASNVLRVALNTYKKCVADDAALSLKRQTFNSIVANAGLDPARYGAKTQKPVPTSEFGGYTKAEFGFIAGQYILHRRSFLTAEKINRTVLEFEWNEAKGCLSFREYIRYISDAGVAQTHDNAGDVYIHGDRILMSLLTIWDGEVRVTMMHVPSRRAGSIGPGPIRTAGVLLTHGFPKRFYQPVVSAVCIQQVLPARRRSALLALCGTLEPGTEEFAAAAADLKVAEEHAVIQTALLWRDRK